MSYRVLALKWRPQTFAEVVGQQHVVRTWRHMIATNTLHNAFLLAGTRGVGKTTLARLLAKAINCEAEQTQRPCGQCQNCVAIAQGQFIDLIEVDAASQTGVDNTRELIESAIYQPASGRMKCFLIDEVHMFSKSSFNALLKTLEEPPKHVIFILATTEQNKVPATIQSRCVQFNLKTLTVDLIAQHITKILTQENISFEPDAVTKIACFARGSLRDGLSLLDQGIAHSQGKLNLVDVDQMLGVSSDEKIDQLLLHVFEGNAKAALEWCDEMHLAALNYRQLLTQIQIKLQQVARQQLLPSEQENRTDPTDYAKLAKLQSAEVVQVLYQMSLQAQRDFDFALHPATGFEMFVIRMLAFRSNSAQ